MNTRRSSHNSAELCPPLDLIMVNYNSSDEALAAIASVYEQLETRVNIQVVDNASRDNPRRIKDAFPKVELILNPKNLGFGRAVNQGLKAGSAPWVMLLNPDTVIPQGGVCRIWQYLVQHPKAAVVGPLILDTDGAVQGSARGFHSLGTALAGRKGLFSRLFPNGRLAARDLPAQNRQDTAPLAVDWVSGACMIVRRSAIERAGGMDERFFMYFEDTDWCRAMKQAGYETVYYQGFEVVHQVGVSSSGRPIRSIWAFHQSCYKYMCKYWLKERAWARLPAAMAVGLRFCLMALLMPVSRAWINIRRLRQKT